ncbi:MAG: hypothetical protein HC800_01660 [Phormidesmis sp. RL_2_1]|nr:hypothetical protein [Phormidesmis sp. RL_2_1]
MNIRRSIDSLVAQSQPVAKKLAESKSIASKAFARATSPLKGSESSNPWWQPFPRKKK